MVVIVAYASTLKVSEANPDIRDDFYSALDKVTKETSKSRHIVITLEDFNAKTGSALENIRKV